jgi:hypothetical protein
VASLGFFPAIGDTFGFIAFGKAFEKLLQLNETSESKVSILLMKWFY